MKNSMKITGPNNSAKHVPFDKLSTNEGNEG